jgi:hypothetical protein
MVLIKVAPDKETFLEIWRGTIVKGLQAHCFVAARAGRQAGIHRQLLIHGEREKRAGQFELAVNHSLRNAMVLDIEEPVSRAVL